MDKDQAKQNLIKLVDRFRSEFESKKTDDYSEEDTKKGFIEPLLSDVLGWDARRRGEGTVEERISKNKKLSGSTSRSDNMLSIQ